MGYCCHGDCILSISHKLNWTGPSWSEKQREGDEWLSQEHIKPESNKDGFRPQGDGVGGSWRGRWGEGAVKLLLVCEEIYDHPPPCITVKLEYTAEGTDQWLVYEPC